ncbi:MAG: hypothetical protein QOF40_551 [Actinomycetota bacterium]|jgi:hypothetical protein|nr:hypothetical protein [Actinomycetota bacterium]
MISNRSGAAGPADLLALARIVERSVPSDLETARTCLRSLNAAIGVQRQRQRMVSRRSLEGRDDADRLRALIARIAHDLESGHVLAVSGLERQVRHYAQQAFSTTPTLST